jgi:hypothetical protein
MAEIQTLNGGQEFSKLEAYLLSKDSPTYTGYYDGKMSYKLHGKSWDEYVEEAFGNLKGLHTSENVFKTVIDLYAENLVPEPDELSGFSNCLMPLLSRGQCPVVVDSAGTAHFPEHYEMISDGNYTVAALFTRNLEDMLDYITFAYTNGKTRLFSKPIPDDFGPADHTEGYTFVEEKNGNTLLRFALDDKGFGATMAALQDRVNHSIIDQTVVAEMYARPFWYLLNVQMPPKNPYMPQSGLVGTDAFEEQKGDGAAGRIFTTSSDGPFGQLDPPTLGDMVSYHDSIIDKVSQASGIPQYYFKPGEGTPPTGVALKVISKRFSNKVARMREDIKENMEELAKLLKVPKNYKDPETEEMSYELWDTDDDLLQESRDAHGTALSAMGYPLDYIASVVTPGVDLNDYQDDSLGVPVPPPGQPADPNAPVDMTAMGQKGLTATPGQVQAYAQNPGQKAAK